MARKSKKKIITVAQLDERIAQQQARIIRAARAIEQLQKQRKRAVRKAAEVDLAIAPPLAKPVAPKPEPLEKALERQEVTPLSIDTSIPDFLKRSKDDPAAEQLKAELAEQKRLKTAGRIAKMKAKASGETRRMPLTGKAALEAIRNG